MCNYRRTCNMHIIGDLQVIRNPHLAAECTTLPDPGATGHADETGNRRMVSNVNIVRNMDLIIELHAVADNRVLQGAPVDRCIGADAHIIADDRSP